MSKLTRKQLEDICLENGIKPLKSINMVSLCEKLKENGVDITDDCEIYSKGKKSPPKVVTKKSPKVVSKKSPKVVTKNSPKVVSKKSPSKVVSKKSPKVVTKKSPKVVTKKSPKVVTKKSPKVVSKKSPSKVVSKKSPSKVVSKKSPSKVVSKKSSKNESEILDFSNINSAEDLLILVKSDYKSKVSHEDLREKYGIVIPPFKNKKDEWNYIENEILFRYPKIIKRKNISPPNINFNKFDFTQLQYYTASEILDYYPLSSSTTWDSFETMVGHIFSGKVDQNIKLSDISINLTGVRNEEMIKGFKNVTKNSLIKIFGFVPPYKKSLDHIRLSVSMWPIFLEKLGSIEFFSEMSPLEKSDWLYKNQSKEKDFSRVENIKIQIISVGDSDIGKKIDQEDIQSILENEYTTPMEVLSKFPAKEGSKANKVSLFFDSTYWKVVQNFKYVDEFSGLYFDIMDGTCKFGKVESKDIIEVEHGTNSKIAFVNESGNINKVMLFDLISEMLDVSLEELDEIELLIKDFSPGVLKSLLQKIIRYRPLYVERYSSSAFLLVTLSLLYLHPGSFVPDIQRWVTGSESFCKRLAVTIFEDSYIEDVHILSSLLMSALLIQKVRQWKPSVELVQNWFHAAVEALDSEKYWKYKTKGPVIKGIEDNKFESYPKLNSVELSSHLLAEIKSFETDIYMIYDISKTNEIIKSKLKRPKNMPLYHCIDQHSVPEVAYYFGYETVSQFGSVSDLFSKFWKSLVGVNTRKNLVEKQDPFVIAAKNAQKNFLISKQTIKKKILNYKKHIMMDFKMEESYIAGLVGAIQMKTTPKTFVTLNPQNIYEMVSIRKPSREMKEAIVDDDIVKDNEKKVWEMLRKQGLKMNKIILPYPNTFENILLKYDDEFYVEIDGKRSTIEEFTNYSFKLPYLSKVCDPILNKGTGIEINAISKFKRLMKEQPSQVIRRLKQFLGDHKTKIEMYKISRDGSSKELIMIDFLVFELLLEMCKLFPIAIEKQEGKTVTFTIHFLGLINYLLSLLREEKVKYKKWNIKLSERKAWPHQVEALDKMIERNKEGKRGQFIWIPVGLGKTQIVLSYLYYLNGINQLPEYIIYSLPDTAIKSFIKEAEPFGFDMELIHPIKSKITSNIKINKTCNLSPFTISLIDHDHLRLCDNLSQYNSIFIIDEVHKTLNDTLRTNHALQLSHNSTEFIAMTGTVVIDTKIYKLIKWLSQINQFEINQNNFWVSVNSMISKKIDTGLDIIREEIIPEFNKKEHKEYYDLVPPGLGGKNYSSKISDLNQAANICYQVCDRYIVEQTLLELKNGNKVFIVARNKEQQKELYGALSHKKVYLIEKGKSILLTKEMVKNKEAKDYDVVITTINQSAGYTITLMNVMITSVYPSNQATREQLEGRINRIGQTSKFVKYITVHVGLLTYIFNHHQDAKNLSDVLNSLVKSI